MSNFNIHFKQKSEKLKPIVRFEQFIKKFPNIKLKSKELAKKILPLYPSIKLAEIIAALLTDGHIDWYTSDNHPRCRKILLYSDNKNECEWFLNIFKELFRIKGDVKKYTSKTSYSQEESYKAEIFNATLARILILAGVPAGDKTKMEYKMPNWIMVSDKKIKTAFLRTLFNFDGSVPNDKKDRPCSWQMTYSMNKERNLLENGVKFLKQIEKLLGEFNIKCGGIGQYKDEGNKYNLHFSFSNQISIVSFYQKISFINLAKQKRLENAVIKILRKGRIKSKEIYPLLERLRRKFGSDKKAINEINKSTVKIYSKRQFEHFRRSETKIPYEVLFATIIINKNEKILNKLPEHVKELWKIFSYRSRSPLINSSNISLATESGN